MPASIRKDTMMNNITDIIEQIPTGGNRPSSQCGNCGRNNVLKAPGSKDMYGDCRYCDSEQVSF